MFTLRRSLTIVVTATLAFLPVFAASASTTTNLEAAKQRLAVARNAANAALRDAHEADVKLQATEDRIAGLEQTVSDLTARAEGLRGAVRERALYAYMHAGSDIDVVIGTNDPLAAARGKALIEHVNQRDNTAAKRLAAINADLRERTAALRDEESKQRAAAGLLDARNNEFQAAYNAALRAADALQAQLDREIAAAKAAERQRLLLQNQAFLASRPGSSLSPGQIVVNPGGGSFMCPVFGSVYTDDYGGPSGHPGIDMFAPTGTRTFAVKAGHVRYVANEGAGGNTAYVQANDGNTYFYAHLSQFVGGERSVSQGEVIGLVGATGNATGPHLHFEIRIGGDNGSRIDPYPTLKAAGC
jgi:murein DD-endopeptidase MepM/ murein hydrolase activator NlpD